MRSKKSAISKAFFYAFSLVIVAFILYIAYNGISNIMKTRCETQTINALKQIKSDLEQRYSSYGEYRKYKIPFICKASKLCFINKSYMGYDPTMVNLIYLEPDDTVVDTYYIKNL